MRVRLIASRDYQARLDRISSSASLVDVRYFNPRLGSRPRDLRVLLQSEIDKSTKSAGYDAVVVASVVSKFSVRDIVSRDVPVLLPFAGDAGASQVLNWLGGALDQVSFLLDVIAGHRDGYAGFVLAPETRLLGVEEDGGYRTASVDDPGWNAELSGVDTVVDSDGGDGSAEGIGLGIDAGGTYTDAVIFDLGAKKLLAKAKALTSYQNLAHGIKNALVQLPSDLLKRVQVTSLSTTLATNSVVEGRGYRVGLLVLSPWDWTEEQVGHGPLVNIPGSVAISGEIIEPLDEEVCRKAIRYLVTRKRCGALAVAGYATVRNPELVNRVREIALAMYDVPVVCAHEASRDLNAVKAAQTAIANARLLPIIHDLIDSVHRALDELNVSGALMLVKGDGTPVDERVARVCPVETILSGPAASVAGARILTGLESALVLDMGGTTTDLAIIDHGRATVCRDGARVGPLTIGVDAVEILAVGLGGDSRISFDREKRISVGPRRNIPLACLAHQYPSVKQFLRDFNAGHHAGEEDASALDVFVKGAEMDIDYTEQEMAFLDLVSAGPVSALRAAKALGALSHKYLPTDRLESYGIVKRSSLTPTDIMHVTGQFQRWDCEASRRALEIWSVMFGKPAQEALELINTTVTRRIFGEIILRELSNDDKGLRELPLDWSSLLEMAFTGSGSGMRLRFEMTRPVIAVGAPAGALAPPVARHLSAEIVVPEDGDVANAVGAIGSDVVVREEVLIKPAQGPSFTVHCREHRLEFRELRAATCKAVDIARDSALARALDAGAVAPRVIVTQRDSTGSASNGNQVFLERSITARASGSPFAMRRERVAS